MTDALTKERLYALAMARSGGPCVSLYIPTHESRCADLRDRSKLKRLLLEATRHLPDDADYLALRGQMGAAEVLVEDHKFWKEQSLGLAVFLEPSQCSWFRVPIKVPELSTTGTSFHLNPLLPLLEKSARFYVLIVEAWRVRMLECTAETHIEYPIAADCECRLSSADEMRRYFQKLSHRIALFASSVASPLLIVGEELPARLLQSSLSEVGLTSERLGIDPAERSELEVRQAASKLLQARADNVRAEMLNLFMHGHGQDNSTDQIELILPAAFLGRVQCLFVASDAQLFGRYDLTEWLVHRHASQQPGDQDLAALAVVVTYVHDGAIFTMDRRDMPGGTDIAAVLR